MEILVSKYYFSLKKNEKTGILKRNEDVRAWVRETLNAAKVFLLCRELRKIQNIKYRQRN